MATIHTSLSTTGIWDWIHDQSGQTFLANGHDRAQVYDGLGSSTRNWGLPEMTAAITFGASAAGALTGDYYYYAVLYNSLTDTEGGQGPISALQTLAAQRITLNRPSGASSLDTQATHWRVYRNTAGQAETFYKVADVAIATTTYSDNNTDDAISAAGNDTLDLDNPKTRIPGQHPFVRLHNGYTFGWGGRTEATGTVAMTNANATVTGTGTKFSDTMVGQTFRIKNQAVLYTILSVASATSLTLTEVYAGTTTSGLDFLIHPENASLASWSVGGHREEFRLFNQVSVGEGDAGTPTGLFVLLDALYLAKDNDLYRWAFTTNPNPVTGDAAIFHVLKGRGLVNHRCCVVVGPYAYILDNRGIYRFEGDYEESKIDRQILPIIQPSYLAAAKRINWAVAEKFHAIHDPKEDRILFFVALGTDTEPKHVLCYDRRRDRWRVESHLSAITASILQRDSQGRERVFVADEYGYLRGYGVNRGVDADTSFTVRGTATSSTNSTLVDSGATFDDGGVDIDRHSGSWVEIYDGTGSGQTRLIAAGPAGSNTTIGVTPNWSVNPDATSKYRIGPIELLFETQNFTMQPLSPNEKKSVHFLRVFFEPNASWTDSYIGITLYKDWSATAFKKWLPAPKRDGLEIPALATTDGEIRAYLDNMTGCVQVSLGHEFARAWRVKLRYKETNRPVAITGIEISGAAVPRLDWRDQ